MTLDLWIAIGALFVSVALLSGYAASAVLARSSPERRRLREMTLAVAGGHLLSAVGPQSGLTERVDPFLARLARAIPKSPREMGRVRRRLAAAGIQSFAVALVYSAAELTLPLIFAVAPLVWMVGKPAWALAAIAALIGYMIPGLILGHLIGNRKRRIENGLPDALDLLIVCIEAGCALDQGIVKTSAELEVSHPDLAAELQLITIEVRAGKNRIEAFKNFAARTRVDDVRSLVAMLVQTDRFGTSVAKALRTHADMLRTKRRQRAEERAAKVGVKLVFPLVFFLFPAFYVVTLGPAVILFIRSAFFAQ